MLQISDSDLVRKAVTTAPVSRSVVSRYVAGETVPEAVRVAKTPIEVWHQDEALAANVPRFGESASRAR